MLKSIIVATDEHGAIGRNNTLMWHLRDDLKRFKELTTGHTIVMGRNTFNSLPNGPLPNRVNVVISSTIKEKEGIICFDTFEKASHYIEAQGEDELFIIGGGKLYGSTLDEADKLYLTVVHHSFPDVDTFFPDWDPRNWDVLKIKHCQANEQNEYDSTFYELRRKKI